MLLVTIATLNQPRNKQLFWLKTLYLVTNAVEIFKNLINECLLGKLLSHRVTISFQ